MALLRDEAGLSQGELAVRGRARDRDQVELGLKEPRLWQILGLCEGLRVSPNVLLRELYEVPP